MKFVVIISALIIVGTVLLNVSDDRRIELMKGKVARLMGPAGAPEASV
jgi:hypothetical protein